MFSRISTVPASTSVHDSLELTALLEDLEMTDLVPILRRLPRVGSVVSLRRLVGYYGLPPNTNAWASLCFRDISLGQRAKLEEWMANGGPAVASPWRRRCVICKCSEDTITKRGGPDVDYFDGAASGAYADGDLICRSCIFKCAPCSPYESQNHLICGGCGYSEFLAELFGRGKFYEQVTGTPTHVFQEELVKLNRNGDIRCRGCQMVEAGEETAIEETAIEETTSGGVGDIDDLDPVVWVVPEDLDWLVSSDDEDPYVGELELAEENEDNGGEQAVRIKETVQNIGEVMFDIREKLTEGEYLQIMNGLQSITNEMNH